MYENALKLDINKMAEETGAQFKSIVRDDTGETIVLPYWNAQQMKAILEDVGERIKGHDGLVMTGRASYAFMGAIVHRVYPLPSYQFVAAHGPLKHDIYEKFLKLEIGEYNPAGQIIFTVDEQGDDVYISFKVDDGTDAGHAYDDELLPLVKVPAVQPGKRIFITGITKYSIAVSIAEAYRDIARSVYMLYRADKDYICAYSNCDEDQVGNTIPSGR